MPRNFWDFILSFNLKHKLGLNVLYLHFTGEKWKSHFKHLGTIILFEVFYPLNAHIYGSCLKVVIYVTSRAYLNSSKAGKWSHAQWLWMWPIAFADVMPFYQEVHWTTLISSNPFPHISYCCQYVKHDWSSSESWNLIYTMSWLFHCLSIY